MARHFYGHQLEQIRVAVLQPGETSVDVVALSLPAQYVVVSAAENPQRFGRIVLISPTGFGRFKGSAGRTSRTFYRFLRLTGIGRLLFAVLARRQVIRWFLRQIFADPAQIPREYERYCWRSCQQPGAFRAPLAFVSGLLNDPRAEGAYKRLANPTLLVFGDHPRFTDPAAADALIPANGLWNGPRSGVPGTFPNSSSQTRPRPSSTGFWPRSATRRSADPRRGRGPRARPDAAATRSVASRRVDAGSDMPVEIRPR